MDSIKKFFDKKKTDVKFKNAGQGKSLSSTSRPTPRQKKEVPRERVTQTAGAQKAGVAALSRLAGSNRSNAPVDWSLHAIKAQAKREIEQERKLQEVCEKTSSMMTEATPQVAEVQQHVLFSNPLDSHIGLYDEIKESIKSTLYKQVGEDKGVASCLIIRTCNKSPDKVRVCVETLCRYVQNIEDNPGEEKYRRIRQSNKAYLDRVKCVEGATLFLEAAGFESKELPFEESTDNFWVFPPEADVSDLSSLRDALVCSEPVRPQLERDPAILLPLQANSNPELPPEFFALSKEELQREIQIRKEQLDQSMVLMTKAMRERMNMREMRKYRFTLIRVRFPDDLTLQGTFKISDKLYEVTGFVKMYLAADETPFSLSISGGSKFTKEDEDKSLAELFLVPAVLLVFHWETERGTEPQDIWGEMAHSLLSGQQEDADS